MGHQVNFYLDTSDTRSLERALAAIGTFCVLHSRSPRALPNVVGSLDIEENGQPWLFFHLVRPIDIGAVVMRPVAAQGYWTVDVVQSPVVEFNRCFSDGTILRRGRVYYVDGFYGQNKEWQEKPEDFRNWARLVLAATRRTLKRHDTDYIGAGAEAWLSSGTGRLAT